MSTCHPNLIQLPPGVSTRTRCSDCACAKILSRGSTLILSSWNGPLRYSWSDVFLHKPGERLHSFPQIAGSLPPSQTSVTSSPAFRSTPRSMAAATLTCGWVDLPKCKRRCWFAHLPAPEAFQNYVAIMDDFGLDLERRGHKFKHLMIW